MKYYKQVTTGAVVKSYAKPTGQWWREATEREYLAYHARLQKLIGNLERAVTYKARVLGVKA